jgi:2-haloacid dehalogenase
VAVGWGAALIKQVGNDVLGVGPQPQMVGDNVNDVADQLIARHKGTALISRRGALTDQHA